MVFKNSENALAIVSGDIDAKKAIALESFSALTNTRKGKVDIIALEDVGSFQDFSMKINDVFNTLQNIDVDETEIITFLKEIDRVPKNLYADASIMFINPDNVGRINAEYIRDFAKDIEIVAEKILRGEITSIAGTNVSTPVIEGIKRQIASGTYKGYSAKTCFEDIPRGIPYPYDSKFINRIAIPFIRSFSAKRLEIADEISSISKASESAFAIVSAISQSKTILSADTEARQLLNVYLAAAGTALVDIVSFVSYLIIRKMDIMIADATALNEMCDNIRGNKLPNMAVESAMDEKNVPKYGIENADMLIGVVRGVYGKIKYEISNYYGETSHPINDQIIMDMQNQYLQMTYPAEIFITILSQKNEAIKRLQQELCAQEFPSPVQIATDLCLYRDMISEYAEKIADISNISSYTSNTVLGPADKAFASLAELHGLERIIEQIAIRGNEAAAALEDLKMMTQNSSSMISTSEAVRKEIVDVANTIESNINMKLIPKIFSAIDERCVRLDAYIESALSATTVIVPDMGSIEEDTDFVESVFCSITAENEIYANLEINEAARKFRAMKNRPITFVATEAEAPATNAGGATPGNPVTAGVTSGNTQGAPSGTNAQENNGEKKVEVTEDETKKTAEDNAKNDEAAGDTTSNPESFKDKVKKLMDQAMKFFEDMIANFSSTVRSKRNADAAQYITENKDAILNRSFNGVTLKIPFFPELSTTEVIKEIGQVTTAVGALNAQSIKSSGEDKLAELLFPFMNFGNVTTSDERISLIKEKYRGKDNAVKEEFTGAKLRTKTQAMMTFCEEYYVNKQGDAVAKALESLKTATRNVLSGLSTITDINSIPEDAKITFINRSVKMFAGAITTTYRNQANAYYSALKSLTPKKRTPNESPDQTVEQQQEQQQTTDASTTV